MKCIVARLLFFLVHLFSLLLDGLYALDGLLCI
jgi:hypothetical protein